MKTTYLVRKSEKIQNGKPLWDVVEHHADGGISVYVTCEKRDQARKQQKQLKEAVASGSL